MCWMEKEIYLKQLNKKNDRLKRVQELKNNSYEDLLKDSKKKSKLAKNFPQL